MFKPGITVKKTFNGKKTSVKFNLLQELGFGQCRVECITSYENLLNALLILNKKLLISEIYFRAYIFINIS